MRCRLKKLLVCMLALVTLLSCVCVVGAASTKPTVTLSSGTVRAGESVQLTVTIENNPGLANCMLYFYYDTSLFSVNTRTGIKAAEDFALDGAVIANSIETAKANGRYTGAEGKDGVLALWYNGSGVDTAEDGVMMTITLKAASGIANGTYSIGLGYSTLDTANQKGERVSLNTVSGAIVVTGGGEEIESTPEPEESPATFSDVAGHWAEAEILKAAELGLVNGYTDGTYGPDKTMTRAECVTILWRASGSPEPKGEATFTDLNPNQVWYLKAVAWAEETGVVNGVGNGKFDPNGTVTREQLVTILHRMAGSPAGMELMLASTYESSYTDSGKISTWAKNAVYWSIYKEIICGEDSLKLGTELSPKSYANRAQIAVMMVRYLNKY